MVHRCPDGPWYRQVSREQWRAFLATFLGWLLDGFDFTIMTFILIDIQESFTVDRALAGALGTVTLMFPAGRWARRRHDGGPVGTQAAADAVDSLVLDLRVPERLLHQLRDAVRVPRAVRHRDGGRVGGRDAARPGALADTPARSGVGPAAGGWYWGYVLSALTFNYIYPLFDGVQDPFGAEGSTVGWRVMFWVGVLPALLVLWIRSGVSESPVWLERQRHLRDGAARDDGVADRVSILRLFRRDLLWATVQSSVLMGAFMFSYYSLSFWYPTFLIEGGRDTLGYLLLFNLTAIGGMAFWGRVSETALGRRGAVTAAALLGVASIPAFLYGSDGAESGTILALGAVVMGASGAAIWGMAPSYLTERFPTAVRGVGPGLTYHVGAALGSMTPFILGRLQDGGMTTGGAMRICIAVSGLLVAALIWMGPETRGRRFMPTEP